MCGRFARARYGIDYVNPLANDHDTRWPLLSSDSPPADTPSWNASPGTLQPVIYPNGVVRRVHWGYRPAWAQAKGLPQIINARVEKLLTSAWKPMLKNGRILAPADQWYEWIKADDGGKQPYAIGTKSHAPLWMAALTNVAPDAEQKPGDGFVLVTAATDTGLVDVHDRRPVVFDADTARQWLDLATSPEVAAELARTAALPPEAFDFFKVGRAVNRPGTDGPDLLNPL
ncbi:SOS response-associated peptidase [Paraburkholderia sp. SIMBA_030]|uniref:SOS response-associated peptidase n=1 Tax=Paraburkholderia sp. SIMBA_030 TaxID=3085773 RepID=UPI00397985B9